MSTALPHDSLPENVVLLSVKRRFTGMSSSTQHHLGDFEQWLKSWSASPRTIVPRIHVLRAALQHWGPPAGVSTRDLQAWLANPDYAAWTRVTYYGHAKSYFGWLTQAGHISADPTLGLRRPTPPKDKPRPLSEAEASMVLDAATGNARSWLMLGMYAGLRAHEIAKLKGQDVDAETIHVVGKGGQSAILPTHPALWELAQDYPRRGYWFPSRSRHGHVTPGSVSTIITRLFSELGIPGSIHRARHTYGTRLLRAGANIRVVQTLMRHESLATTALYTAVDEDERAAAINSLVA